MTDPQVLVYGSQIQKWTDDIQMLVKERDQYKAERDTLQKENERLRKLINKKEW